jgi:1-pyrroline-5-carboxylate dehydrogenase
MLSDIKTGREIDFRNAINSVIDEPSFDRIMAYIDYARTLSTFEIIIGCKGDKSKGFFIEPTVIVASDPHFITMEEDI